MRRLGVMLGAAFVAASVIAQGAVAAPRLAYGIQDDAWLAYGPGTVEQRVAALKEIGARAVRVTVRWDAVEATEGVDDWSQPDAILPALLDAGLQPVVTLYGTPGWANSGRAANVAPASGSAFASFAAAAAERYPGVHRWTIWNEPNQRRWLSRPSPALYVRRLLNPAYAAIHGVSPQSQVAGGVTAPRGGAGGVSPVAFIRGMGRAGAKLDAYAHHPYALQPGESPWGGGCSRCQTITMATLPRLLQETARAFRRPVRLWLTELGYQSNPPDRILGVPPEMQASYLAAAAYRAFATPRVDLLIQYLFRDEPGADRWQSGLETTSGRPKPALGAFAAPLAQVRRSGSATTVWGAVRPGSGTRTYRLQRQTTTGWATVGGIARTARNGALVRTLRAVPGARLRLVAAGLRGNTLTVR